MPDLCDVRSVGNAKFCICFAIDIEEQLRAQMGPYGIALGMKTIETFPLSPTLQLTGPQR